MKHAVRGIVLRKIDTGRTTSATGLRPTVSPANATARARPGFQWVMSACHRSLGCAASNRTNELFGRFCGCGVTNPGGTGSARLWLPGGRRRGAHRDGTRWCAPRHPGPDPPAPCGARPPRPQDRLAGGGGPGRSMSMRTTSGRAADGSAQDGRGTRGVHKEAHPLALGGRGRCSRGENRSRHR